MQGIQFPLSQSRNYPGLRLNLIEFGREYAVYKQLAVARGGRQRRGFERNKHLRTVAVHALLS